MKAEVRSVVMFCRGFYILMHGLALTCFYQFPLNISPTGLTILLTLKAVAGLLFFTAGRNPGYLRDSLLPIEMQETQAWAPNKRYCQECELLCPYRAKHCNKCEECIAKYDHHCFWLGSCVGQLNHFRFVTYLIFECVSLDWVALLSFDSFGLSDEAAGAYVVLILVAGGFGILTTGLCVYHVYLISIGSTTWEQIKRPDYLRLYPESFNPFNKGILMNWWEAAATPHLIDWALPEPLTEYPFNWCDNEYWVCC
mmetsp:Transcript_25523/g.44507  ORF Transcript_25523/g.44507 Transcript_25523/m.44507 type:complete len:254 (-) Transcript_25523:2550-3311(-)